MFTVCRCTPTTSRRLGLAQPLLHDQHQRPPAQFLLRRPANAAKVPRFHAQSIAGRKPFVRYIYGILVMVVTRMGALTLRSRGAFPCGNMRSPWFVRRRCSACSPSHGLRGGAAMHRRGRRAGRVHRRAALHLRLRKRQSSHRTAGWIKLGLRHAAPKLRPPVPATLTPGRASCLIPGDRSLEHHNSAGSGQATELAAPLRW